MGSNNLSVAKTSLRTASSRIRTQVFSFPITVPLLMLLVLGTGLSLLNPRFLSSQNLMGVSAQLVPLAILAMAQTFVIMSGGIDMSTGYGVALVGLMTQLSLTQFHSFPAALGAALLTGLALGGLNAFFIAVTRLQPFIVTLATMSMAQGLSLIFAVGRFLFVTDPIFNFIGKGFLGPLPISVLIMLLIYFVCHLLHRNTRFGKYTMALGSNESALRLVGVRVAGYRALIYLFSCLFTGIAALLLIARMSLISHNLAGPPILMDSVTAIVIGGTSMDGGSGNLWGTLLGVCVVTLIGNGLSLLNVPPTYQDVFKGAVLVVALLMSQVFARGRKVSRPTQTRGTR